MSKEYNEYHVEIAREVEAGKVLLHATDTIPGLACDIENEEAYLRLQKIKNREKDKPFLLLVSDVAMLKNYVEYIHPRVENLLNVHQRPLSVIYREVKNIPSYGLGENGTVGIRICRDYQCQQLIKDIGRPITTTSANLKENEFPSTFDEISPAVKEQVDLVLYPTEEQRVSMSGKPSVIAQFDKKNGELSFLR